MKSTLTCPTCKSTLGHNARVFICIGNPSVNTNQRKENQEKETIPSKPLVWDMCSFLDNSSYQHEM